MVVYPGQTSDPSLVWKECDVFKIKDDDDDDVMKSCKNSPIYPKGLTNQDEKYLVNVTKGQCM